LKFWFVWKHRGKFLRSVLASMRKAVLQHKGRHASCSHVLGNIDALAGDGVIKPPPGQVTTAVPFLNSGEGLKTVRLGLVTLATTSVFQIFEKYSFSG
jgi:hypothetical protein